MSESGRKLLREVFIEAVRDLAPRRIVSEQVRRSGDRLDLAGLRMDLGESGRIFAIAAGKAAGGMALGLQDSLGEGIAAAVLLTNQPVAGLTSTWSQIACTHPLPTEQNVEAAEAALSLAKGAVAGDLVICLISGGASSMLSLPAERITIGEKAETARLLMRAGADIGALNTVRKHLSRIKGGGLARAAAPARCVTLAISDVPGDDPSVIASGPTVPDVTTFADAWQVIESFDLMSKLPDSIRRHLQRGLAGEIAETLKPVDAPDTLDTFRLVCANRDMLMALERHLRWRNCHVLVEPEHFSGEARDLGGQCARRALAIAGKLRAENLPYALVCGGETTVTVRGDGLGGRNSEAALAAAIQLDGDDRCTMLFAGTDGIDGPTDAAGAVADGDSLRRGRSLGLSAQDRLDANDAYRFFAPLGDLVRPGATGTNVMDVAIALVEHDRQPSLPSELMKGQYR